jgi:hypothetical protein
MLETDIRAVYQRMAEIEPPPSSTVSIPAAHRQGRSRLRWRQASLIGAPLLAASAVLAIALSDTVLSGTAPPPARPAEPVPATAPAQFSLRPYAWFGWLPGSQRGQVEVQLALKTQALTVGQPSVAIVLQVQAAHICAVRSDQLACSGAGSPQPPNNALGRQVGLVDGHPAYWNGVLIWQYASGGWAWLGAADRQQALRIAASVRFGPTAGPPVRFPFQLTDVPASWHVGDILTRWLRGDLYASVFAVTVGQLDNFGSIIPQSETTAFTVLPAGEQSCTTWMGGYDPSEHMVKGYEVLVATSGTTVERSLACVSASGLFIAITTERGVPASSLDLFAYHMQLLGPDPANWTTQPIR